MFITTRSNRIIVSDGGQLGEFINNAVDDEDFLSSIVGRFGSLYGVKEFVQNERRTLFFKECKGAKLISSIAFDLCNFVTAVANSSMLAIAEEESQEARSFKTKADSFINRLKIVKLRSVEFGQRLPEIKEATFSAVIHTSSQLWLVPYLTGSSPTYFERSISNTIINIGIAKRSRLNSQIAAIIPFLNDKASGYDPTRFTQRLAMLSSVSDDRVVKWSDKASLKEYLKVSA